MSRAHLASLLIFLAIALAGLAAFFAIRPAALAIAAFLAVGLVGSWLAGKAYDRLSTPEERRADLEDRVRNPDP